MVYQINKYLFILNCIQTRTSSPFMKYPQSFLHDESKQYSANRTQQCTQSQLNENTPHLNKGKLIKEVNKREPETNIENV